MSRPQRIGAIVLIALLVLSAYGLWATYPQATPLRAAQAAAGGGALPNIDQNTYLTAQRLARLATTPEEQPLAQAAVQTADHELDLAFAAAMRRLEAHPPSLSPEAAQIQQRLQDAQKELAVQTEGVKRLTAQLAQAKDEDKPALEDRLQLAQAQLELQQDAVQEANDDLLQAGGNAHQRIQMMQQEHEATEHNAAAAAPAATPNALSMLQGMVGDLRAWLALHRKRGWLAEAQEQVDTSIKQLMQERQRLVDELAASKAQLPNSAGTKGTSASAAAAPDTVLSATRRIASDQHRITLRDQRISARRRLADIYTQWGAVVSGQARAVAHDILQGTAIIAVALLLLLFADRWVERLLGRARIDRRQLATLRSVVGVALQLVGIVIILLVLVGLPGQTATMLGIVGAGLTVALKDFLVAFIGWFVLMGRNGIRLGDWVEINGVSGEVVELNMFHTVLLETGNWTAAGQPTGRRVTFTNSFAIGGHYFNFSTAGQWLWDELSVLVPYGRDAHAIAEAIQKEVTAATADGVAQAEQEWRRASRGQAGGTFTAQPVVAVRPASGGFEIVVRYVTRASERFALRARLYQSAVQMLAQQGP
jgi:small-conductance mechanosensitive channel